ncbi:uncharacterized protein LOC124453199 isoform X2 [Xenia sp. Carnegie-2017]|uniref:uncharacterized protein LOC124453199 isoform X2 n=1 Tax=Xenia sp. Carnegie-2017 TaxID=2897299 RepID=UPI001F048103|nr:uncharacterized protein LOC124453199 isoform X2 [Xenia sp. Carnegie-2017]XP_046859918.1 uncharacterized protein LOC124453199 isoform X2 [Xenia sp. Carnegie-2017]
MNNYEEFAVYCGGSHLTPIAEEGKVKGQLEPIILSYKIKKILPLFVMSFTVYINEGERYQINEWVMKYEDIETGGDLFGLWLNETTAVIQFVVGPGKKSRRDETSFYQDVDYLDKAGTYLTKNHGLCNVGQWHSHHKIRLFKPSQGDENTVWNNMPNLGLQRYIVFIANITNKVEVNCFLFHLDRQRPVIKGEFIYVPGNSPFRLNEVILRNAYKGAESFNEFQWFEKEMKHFQRGNNASDQEVIHHTDSGNNSLRSYPREQSTTSRTVDLMNQKKTHTKNNTQLEKRINPVSSVIPYVEEEPINMKTPSTEGKSFSGFITKTLQVHYQIMMKESQVALTYVNLPVNQERREMRRVG